MHSSKVPNGNAGLPDSSTAWAQPSESIARMPLGHATANCGSSLPGCVHPASSSG